MPFNFQPTIFSAKMQYNRPCKFSRPCLIYINIFKRRLYVREDRINMNFKVVVMFLMSMKY